MWCRNPAQRKSTSTHLTHLVKRPDICLCITRSLPQALQYRNLKSSKTGDEAAIVGDLGEETGLLGASFMDSRVPASARKKFFSNLRNLQTYSFKPGKRRTRNVSRVPGVALSPG